MKDLKGITITIPFSDDITFNIKMPNNIYKLL